MTERAYHRWSGQEDSELIRSLSDGDDLHDIAEAHGRSVGAIRSRITHLYNEGRISIYDPLRPFLTFLLNEPDVLTPPDYNILIIGAGGIGGLLAHHVSRAVAFSGLTDQIGTLRLTLMDGDIVEQRNLPHQPFEQHAQNSYKVNAIASTLDFIGVEASIGIQIETITKDFTYDGKEEGEISDYDLVVVAVDRELPRKWVHRKAKHWLDLRARGDGFVMWSHQDDLRILDSLPKLPEGTSTSCQLEGAVESGNIQFGFALAAAHGAQWIVQWLRGANVPSAKMYSIHMGEFPLPQMTQELVE